MRSSYSQPTAATLKKGDVLAGKYRVERALGRGGMGIVAAAWDLALERPVAVKMLRPEGHDAEAVERFHREARAVSKLRSEHVVRVFDVGVLDDGTPFLVMELLEGEDLDALAGTRALGIEEALGYVLQACEGLAEAHAHKIVHRDLKPANLFVTRRPDGRPLLKLVDFGVAKQVDRRSLVELTAPLVAVGSVLYMSPEQARGLPDVGITSDVWSLGVCLYELLTRRLPFEGETTFDIIANVLKETPEPPDARSPGLPKGLSEVVMRCLAKDATARYPDVASLAEALEPFAGASAVGTAQRVRLVLQGGGSAMSRPSGAAGVRAVRRDAETLDAPPSRDTNDTQREAGAPTLDGTDAPRPPARRGRTALVFGMSVVALALGIVALARRPRIPPPEAATLAVQTAVESPVVFTVPLRETASARVAPAVPPVPPSPPANVAHAERAERRASSPVPAKVPAPIAVVPPPATEPAPAAPSVTAPAAPPAPPEPSRPRYVLASAHVELGTPTNLFGTTAANVSRAVAPQVSRLTACYRDALPSLAGPVSGAGVLHLDTDEDGLVVAARVAGPFSVAARCIVGVVSGRKIPNVDTGRASADVPLVFVAQ